MNDDNKSAMAPYTKKWTLTEPRRLLFLHQLRSARASAIADAEGFMAIVHGIELIGCQLFGKISGLGRYKDDLRELASSSPLCATIPNSHQTWHAPFDHLFDELRIARNDAVHQGTYARILTEHAIGLAIILEDALMQGSTAVSQFMVRNVLQAELNHPISYVRQLMLTNAFSYLPIWTGKKWGLLSEAGLARYLHLPKLREARLLKPTANALEEGLSILPAKKIAPETKISEIAPKIGERPVLILKRGNRGTLLGLLTASDIL